MLNIHKRFLSIKSHVGARDESLIRIAFQASPYFFSRQGFSFYPRIVFLSINSICNLSCAMCDVGQKDSESYFYKNLVTDGSAQLSLEALQDLFTELKEFRPLISITSTEPLLHKDIVQICKSALELGLKIQLTTNGYLLEKYAGAFVDIGLPRLTVSLDGPPQIHDKIRGVENSFQRAKRGLERIDTLKRKRNVNLPGLYTICVISNLNYFALVDMIRQFKDIQIEKNIFSHMTFITPEMVGIHNARYREKYPITTSSLSGTIDPLAVDLNVLDKQIKSLKRDYPNQCLFSPVMDSNDLETYYRRPEVFLNAKRCFIPWMVAQIIATGDVIPMTRCFNTSMGNIHKKGFKDIWNGKAFLNFRKDLRKNRAFPACSRCRGVL